MQVISCFGFLVQCLVELLYVSVYVQPLFWPHTCIFPSFETILDKCNKLWPIAELETAYKIFKFKVQY